MASMCGLGVELGAGWAFAHGAAIMVKLQMKPRANRVLVIVCSYERVSRVTRTRANLKAVANCLKGRIGSSQRRHANRIPDERRKEKHHDPGAQKISPDDSGRCRGRQLLCIPRARCRRTDLSVAPHHARPAVCGG